MEPVACRGLENPAPPDKDPDPSSQPPAGIDKAWCGEVQGKTSALYLKMLSLRVGLGGWYFCLKKVQWDVVRWIYISLELATDVFFSWVQNALLAFMMLLLLAWKVRSGARQHGWRMLLRSLVSGDGEGHAGKEEDLVLGCFCSRLLINLGKGWESSAISHCNLPLKLLRAATPRLTMKTDWLI